MSAPSTPTKRLLTEEAYSTFNAPRFPYDGCISEDLTVRLQNLGTRVRKSVTEGYSTQRFGVSPSAAPTPFSSPEKASAATFSSQASPIFRSANDTLLDVFSTPVRTARVASSSSLTPRKRGRSEPNSQEENDGCSQRGVDAVVDEDEDMSELDSASDDEIAIITGGSPRRNRPVRPLKKSARTYRPPALINVNVTPQSVQPYFGSADTGTLIHATVASAEWKDMFSQPF